MSISRDNFTATTLTDGHVLIAGGQTGASGTTVQSAELYDPATKTFSAPFNMTASRQSHTATVLICPAGNPGCSWGGKVLITGGFNNGSTRTGDLFNPVTGTFAATAGQMAVPFRGRSAAALLSDGRVLIAGGQPNDATNAAEIYDPAADNFTATGSMATQRQSLTATTLADGSVLVAGGSETQFVSSYPLPLGTLERWVLASNGFVPAGSMEARRSQFVAVKLANDKVLLAGGSSQSWMTGNTAELYDSSAGPALTTTTVPDGQVGVPYPNTVLAAAGGAGGPYSITQVSGMLPPGLIYTAATATLAGTPTTTGVFVAGMKVTDSANNSNVQSLTIRVGTINVITTPYRLTDGALDHLYDVVLTATGMAPITWSLAPPSSSPPTNLLPTGLSVTSNGHITGTPTVTGFFNFVVRAVDATGQAAVKVLAISIQSPLDITTTSLGNGVLFEGYGGCISTSNGVGTRTFTVSSGALPPGVLLQSNGCFSGSTNGIGAFNFTVRVTDQSSPQQMDSQPLSITIALAVDQVAGSDNTQPALNFGGGLNAAQLGQRVTAGVTGFMNVIRLNGLSCPNGTNVTARIQGVNSVGAPDGNTLVSGTAVTPFPGIALSSAVFFAADEQFAIVFSADQQCSVQPQAFDSYAGGDGYIFSSSWQRLRDTADARYDIPFSTLIQPPAGLAFMTRGRGEHTATLLTCPISNPSCAWNGLVLLTGQDQTAELYNPSNGSFTATGNMNVARQRHTATLLDTGDVLITGGEQFINCSPCTTVYLSSAELFHPDLGTFESLSTSLSSSRAFHTATKLSDGRVLVAGGQNSTTLNSAQIYNPGSRTFDPPLTMINSRQSHTATLLNDNRVLLAGGFGSNFGSAEIFDPNGSTFTATQNQLAGRGQHTATLLIASGKVLIAGGNNSTNLATAELFDPAGGGSFASAGNMGIPRAIHTATLLGDGSVLVAGGLNDRTSNFLLQPYAVMDRYVPGTGWVNAGSMLAERYDHAATLLQNGKVLFTGTFGWSTLAGRSGELYTPATAVSLASTTLPQGYVGDPWPGAQLSVIGGTAPYTYAQVSGSLPPGINGSVSSNGAVPSGTPTAAGTFSIGVQVTDSSNPVLHSNVQTLSIRINDILAITTSSLPSAVIGRGYAQTIAATGGTGARHFSVSAGTLPPGLDLGVDGTLQGSPTGSGVFNFTVRVDDSAGHFATHAYSIDCSIAADESVWTNTFPYGGNITFNSLVVDPTTANNVYAVATFRGIHRSTDAAASWTAIEDFAASPPFGRFTWGPLTMTPSGTLYFGSGSSIYQSTDKGSTWTWVSSTLGGPPCCFQEFVVSPSSSSVVYATTNNAGIFKTTTGGQTWTPVNNGLPASVSPGPYDSILSLAIDPASTNTVFVGTAANGVYKSLDGGQNWAAVDTTFTLVPSPTNIRRAAAIAVNGADSNYLVAAGTATNNIDGIFTSSNGGATWTRAAINPNFCCNNSGRMIVIDPGATRNTDKIYVSQSANVWRSADGGGSWTLVPVSPTSFVTEIAIDPANPQVLYAATSVDGVFKSTNSGQTWASATAGIRAHYLPHAYAHSLEVDRSSPTTVYAGTDGRGLKSPTAGTTWSAWNLPDFRASTLATHPSAPGVVYAFSSSLYKSTDSGGNWTKLGGPSFCCWNDGDLAIAPTNPQTVYFAAAGSSSAATGIYKSIDSGANWSLLAMNGLTNTAIHTLAVDPLDENIVYAGTQGAGRCCTSGTAGIFKSTDGGVNWTQLTNGIPSTIKPTQISIFHTLTQHVIYLGAGENSDNGVYKSLDGGASWARVLQENVYSVVIDPTNSGTVYVGTFNTQGFYRTTDGFAHWTTLNEGLSLNPGIDSIVIDPANSHRVLIGTTAGVYVRTFP
jgi:photosystem II stability/assembly factor-like uncharacterized protein